MNYFVIGVSGVTCGGKTTLTKLLERSFPWCHVIHQDTYFYDDDHPNHVRMPEIENHVNYESPCSLNMDQMQEDVLKILSETGEFHYDSSFNTPSFDTGVELLKTIKDISKNYDTTKYSKIPVLILEGFTIFTSKTLFEKCDARFFLTLPEDECRKRRVQRSYTPADCPGYFDKAIWPEYTKHFEEFIEKTPGIKVFDSTDPMENIWKQSLDIIICGLEERQLLLRSKN